MFTLVLNYDDPSALRKEQSRYYYCFRSPCMFQSGCGATVHQVDEFDIRKNNDRKKKFAGFVAFATKGNAKKKKKTNWTSSQSKFLNAFKTNRLITVQLK